MYRDGRRGAEGLNTVIVESYVDELSYILTAIRREKDPREVISLCRIATNMVKSIRQLADIDLRELDRDTGN